MNTSNKWFPTSKVAKELENGKTYTVRYLKRRILNMTWNGKSFGERVDDESNSRNKYEVLLDNYH